MAIGSFFRLLGVGTYMAGSSIASSSRKADAAARARRDGYCTYYFEGKQYHVATGRQCSEMHRDNATYVVDTYTNQILENKSLFYEQKQNRERAEEARREGKLGYIELHKYDREQYDGCHDITRELSTGKICGISHNSRTGKDYFYYIRHNGKHYEAYDVREIDSETSRKYPSLTDTSNMLSFNEKGEIFSYSKKS